MEKEEQLAKIMQKLDSIKEEIDRIKELTIFDELEESADYEHNLHMLVNGLNILI